MELRHIRYFLAVAEEGNFTRAAARLGIGQPPLSQQIKDLETEVGARLFHRVPHGAELTEAGKAFRAAVAPLPGQATGAIEAARRAALGESGHLRLGITASAALNPIVPASIRMFRRNYPGVELHLEENNSLVLLKHILEDRLDIAIMRPSTSDPTDLKVEQLTEDELIAAVPGSHAAARTEGPIDLATLADDPLIMTSPAVGPSLYDAAINACRAAGFEPTLGPGAPQIVSILSLVAAELGVSLVPASMRQLDVKGVTYRSIRAPAPGVALSLAISKTRPPIPAVNFAGLARRAAKVG